MEFGAIFFSGGLTCIDFCNTFDHLHTPPQFDLIPDRATILKWGQAAGIIPPGFQDARTVDEQVFVRAVKARALIFQLFVPFTRFATPAESDFKSFNSLLQEVSSKLKVVSAADGYVLTCCTDDPLEKVLCEVVRSATDLLLSNQLEQVKQCQECGWLFYDSTRNHSRRWCNMKICGNKAKARRHYERVKQRRIATT